MRQLYIGRRLALLAVGFFTAVAGVQIVLGNSTGWFESEGCDTYGSTFAPGGGIESFAAAVAFDQSYCNWVYISGQYYAYPTWYYPVGPGWSYEPSDGEYTYWAAGATIADFEHSACEAGGSCSAAQFEWSHYPDP